MDLWSFNIIEIDANWRPIRVFLFVFHCNYNVYADCFRDDNELLVKTAFLLLLLSPVLFEALVWTPLIQCHSTTECAHVIIMSLLRQRQKVEQDNGNTTQNTTDIQQERVRAIA